MTDEVRVFVLEDTGGDERGQVFPFSLQGVELSAAYERPFPVVDVHLATLVPGAVRGNHYHVEQHEILLVLATSPWSLHWDGGEGTPAERRTFTGRTAAAILVPPGCAHAIRNDGEADLQLIGLANRVYDTRDPDVHRREVVS